CKGGSPGGSRHHRPRGSRDLTSGAACAGRGGGPQTPSGLLFFGARRGSVEKPEEPVELRAGPPMLRGDGKREAELADGRFELSSLDVDTREVDVRVVPWLVPRCLHRLSEPGHRLLRAPQGDEVGANVVVRVAERGVDRDRTVALTNRSRVVSLRG